MFKYRKVMLFVNRAVYLMSAAMLVAGMVLTILPKPVICNPLQSIACGNIDGNQALNTPGLASDSGRSRWWNIVPCTTCWSLRWILKSVVMIQIGLSTEKLSGAMWNQLDE